MPDLQRHAGHGPDDPTDDDRWPDGFGDDTWWHG